jgi:hypothetical protein
MDDLDFLAVEYCALSIPSTNRAKTVGNGIGLENRRTQTAVVLSSFSVKTVSYSTVLSRLPSLGCSLVKNRRTKDGSYHHICHVSAALDSAMHLLAQIKSRFHLIDREAIVVNDEHHDDPLS